MNIFSIFNTSRRQSPSTSSTSSCDKNTQFIYAHTNFFLTPWYKCIYIYIFQLLDIIFWRKISKELENFEIFYMKLIFFPQFFPNLFFAKEEMTVFFLKKSLYMRWYLVIPF